jgi:pimeloyl-ACP methyl ester carboxylesterase
MRRSILLLSLLLLLPVALAATAAVLSDLPHPIDPHGDYLLYLHGRILEEEGPRPTSPRFGVYEYRQILDTFAGHGFTVISEVRPKGTDVAAYAKKVAEQVRALLAAGVPPGRIAVVGFSKGGGITLAAAAELRDQPKVRFVSLAGCGGRKLDLPQPILSLRDSVDDLSTSCGEGFSATPARSPSEHREITLHVGKGHGTFYRPDPVWVEPVVGWLRAERGRK